MSVSSSQTAGWAMRSFVSSATAARCSRKAVPKAAEPPFDVNVSVAGVQKLTIEVDFGQDQTSATASCGAAAPPRVIRPAAK